MSQLFYEAFARAKQFIEDHPDEAQKEIEVGTVIGDRYEVTAKTRDFEFLLDEEKPIGGYDSGPNPLEYILAALGASQTAAYQLIAAEKGIELQNVKIKLKGLIDLKGFLELDKNVKPGFLNLEYDVLIVSDEDPEILQDLIREADRRSPILNTLSRTVEVEGQLKLPVLQ